MSQINQRGDVSFFCPFVLFRLSKDQQIPAHKGENHLLYSVY